MFEFFWYHLLTRSRRKNDKTNCLWWWWWWWTYCYSFLNRLKTRVYRFNNINSFYLIEQTGTSNDINLTTNSQTSSTIVDSTKRERCPYGKSCYRKNPIHRQQAIHPGDSDWETEEDEKDKTKPECPYGNECYRKNPDHLNEYHHSKKRSIQIKTKQRSTKRKGNIFIHSYIRENKKSLDFDDDDDDDGLPNEYDYNDTFIVDDEDLDSTDCSTDEEGRFNN